MKVSAWLAFVDHRDAGFWRTWAVAQGTMGSFGVVCFLQHAFRLYEGELGVRMGVDMAAQTDDIDIASFTRLSLALEDTAAPPLETVFKDLAFDPQPSVQKGRAWRWKQSRGDTLVEFLTPSFDEKEGLQPLSALGVTG